MKNLLCVALFWVLVAPMAAQEAREIERPKLVVGIVVDQMRYDYLSRYWDDYGDEGFKRLISGGYSCRNLHYNYGPTFTGPGHASIYTGTTPRYHGIIANDWYSKEFDRSVYCSEDFSMRSVGADTPKGQMSPANMIATTMCDELKLNTAGKSKVVGVSMKDRGATLTAGHAADAAYWMTDRWITSSYYTDSLPQWVADFNEQMDDYYPKVWTPLRDIETYDESWPDDNDYEYYFNGMERPVFPYDFEKLMPENGGIGMIKSTPFGNTITAEFAKAAILHEEMGSDEITDFLALSFSSPDYMGHMFGPQAVEIQDNYLRLDNEIADFLKFLDAEIGENEYLVFLTSDHGGAWVPSHMESLKIPAGYIDDEFLIKASQEFLTQRYSATDLILDYSNDQFFLNNALIVERGHDPKEVARALADFAMQMEGVSETYTASDLRRNEYTVGPVARIQRGFNHQRSGDVIVLFEPGWIGYGRRGTTHGSPYTYDSHVPALFYGTGVSPGYTDKELSITDIAPTVCTLLQIGFPNAMTGEPIRQITERSSK